MIDMKSNKKTSTYEKKKPVGLRILVCAIAVLMIVGIVVSAAAPAIENAYALKNMSVAYADDKEMEEATKWLSCRISQHGCNRDDSCTGCSTMMILQNCGLLTDPDWQWGEPTKGVIISNTSVTNAKGKYIEDFATQVSTLGQISRGSAWYWNNGSGVNAADLKKWTDDKLLPVTSSQASGASVNGYAAGCITGLDGKAFHNMSHDELVKAFKKLWDLGLFMIVCGGTTPNNGPSGFQASHASNVAGVTDNEIYIADVWDGVIYPVGNLQSGYIQYLICYYSDETSPQELMGGKRSSNADNKKEVKDSEGNTVAVSMDGFYEEDNYVSVSYLEEPPVLLPEFKDLSITDQMAVREWKDDIETPKDTRLISILRGVVAFVGIILTFYSAMLYVAFQFDRNQNFIELELLSILTLGRLRVSPEEGRSTFTTNNSSVDGKAEVKASKAKFVVHKDIIIISLIGMAAGILILSGKVYYLIMAVVKFVTNLFE